MYTVIELCSSVQAWTSSGCSAFELLAVKTGLQKVWGNKHSDSHQILLRSGAIHRREERLLFIFVIKKWIYNTDKPPHETHNNTE